MSERALPQSGELWQHFKGNKYWIVGVASKAYKDILENKEFIIYTESWIEIIKELNQESDFIVRDSEDDTKYYYIKYRDNKWSLYLASLDIGEFSLGWARPIDNFMSKENRGDNGYRFTKFDI